MNDHTLDRNEHDEEHKKSLYSTLTSVYLSPLIDEMDSMIIEHKKMLYPQTTIPLSEVLYFL